MGKTKNKTHTRSQSAPVQLSLCSDKVMEESVSRQRDTDEETESAAPVTPATPLVLYEDIFPDLAARENKISCEIRAVPLRDTETEREEDDKDAELDSLVRSFMLTLRREGIASETLKREESERKTEIEPAAQRISENTTQEVQPISIDTSAEVLRSQRTPQRISGVKEQREALVRREGVVRVTQRAIERVLRRESALAVSALLCACVVWRESESETLQKHVTSENERVSALYEENEGEKEQGESERERDWPFAVRVAFSLFFHALSLYLSLLFFPLRCVEWCLQLAYTTLSLVTVLLLSLGETSEKNMPRALLKGHAVEVF